MADLDLTLLGGFSLRRAGLGTIPHVGRKGVLLLARLACPLGAPQGRARLQAMLWPGSDQRHAQGSLRFLLHQLRRTLGDAMAGDGETVWLDPSVVTADVTRFEALAAQGTLAALREACALYRGDLLPNLDDTGADCSDWLPPERERLHALARAAFHALFGLLLWRGEIAEAERCARRWVEIDPCCERMHAALMRLHISQGRRAVAARRYVRLRERLARELQIEPGPELESAAARLGGPRSPSRPRFDAAWVLGRGDGDALDAPPLVAVSLFRDLSDGTGLGALTAALTEDVISDLARFRRLAVLGRNTTLALAGRVDAEPFLRRLGVRYLVEGAVRRAGNGLDVSARLVASGSDRCLWAGRFRGGLEALPAFQEQTARAIVGAVPVQIEAAELARIRHLEIQSLTAYELYLRGREQQRATSSDSHSSAFRYFSEALERDPDFAAAHAALALSQFNLGACSPAEDGGRRLRRSVEHASRATALDPLNPQGHWMLGIMRQMLRDFDAAAPELDRAMDLGPGDSEALAYVGLEQAYGGNAELGIERAREAVRLDPCCPPAFAELLGKACYVGRRYEDALLWLRQSPDRVPTNRAWLAAAAAQAGRVVEAAAHARALRATLERRLGEKGLAEIGGPIAWLRGPARFRHAEDLEHYERGLTLAGLG